MIRHTALIVVAATILGLADARAAQEPVFDPAPLLSEALYVARHHAYRRNKVDWPVLEAQVRVKAAGARDALDLLPAYVVLLNGLGDNHSRVQASAARTEAFEARHGLSFEAASGIRRSGPIVTSTFGERRQQESRTVTLVGGRVAQLLVVPAFRGDEPMIQAYANGLFGSLASAAPRACGYILDLRGNGGGNMWPMVTGLAPLLGDGLALGHRDAAGVNSTRGILRGGASYWVGPERGGEVIVAVEGWRDLGLEGAPVAVLQDDAVASSGEAVLAVFAGRARTRSFGQKSYGVASSNRGFELSDQTNLVITTAMMTDRQGRIYPDGFSPDEPIVSGPGKADDPDDAVVEAAKSWLGRQPGCRQAG